MLLSPAKADVYISPLLQSLTVPAALVWGLLCLIDDIRSWTHPSTRLWKIMLIPALTQVILNSIVFLLWAINVIISYIPALIFVISFTLIFAIGGTIWFGSRMHEEEGK